MTDKRNNKSKFISSHGGHLSLVKNVLTPPFHFYKSADRSCRLQTLELSLSDMRRQISFNLHGPYKCIRFKCLYSYKHKRIFHSQNNQDDLCAGIWEGTSIYSMQTNVKVKCITVALYLVLKLTGPHSDKIRYTLEHLKI